MIRLAQPTEPYWIDLGAGCRMKVRPPTTALMETARTATRRRLEELRAAAGEVAGAGASVTGLPDLADPDVFAGEFSARLSETLARFAVVDWEGFLLADGTPAPLTAENLRLAMQIDAVGRTFVGLYLTSLEELAAEGNASAPAPNGSSAAGATTARAAQDPAG